MNKNQTVTDFIDVAPENQKEILNTLRSLIIKTVPEAEELFKWKMPVYRTSKDFCYLNSSKQHATLGFNNFEKINDSLQVLEGTGKSMRHIKIKSMSDIKKEFKYYILSASKFS